jgi:hypothetical protein
MYITTKSNDFVVTYVTSIFKKPKHSQQIDVGIESHHRANHMVEDTTIVREEAVHWEKGHTDSLKGNFT